MVRDDDHGVGPIELRVGELHPLVPDAVTVELVRVLDAEVIRRGTVGLHRWLVGAKAEREWLESDRIEGGDRAGSAVAGFGSAVLEVLEDIPSRVLRLGLPDRFIEHGSREDCLTLAGLDRAAVEGAITRWWHAGKRLAVGG